MYRVLDNFLDFPEREREVAIESLYEEIKHDGYTFPGFKLVEDRPSMRKLEAFLPKSSSFHAAYRRYLPEDEAKQATFIHNDSNIGTYSAIVNLADKPIQFAFWQHKVTGWAHHPTVGMLEEAGKPNTPDTFLTIHEDGLYPSLWDLKEVLTLDFNQCVVFPSHYYHSRYPRTPIGKSTADSRLIKVFFYKV